MFTSKPTSKNGARSHEGDSGTSIYKKSNGRSLNSWLGNGWSGNGHRNGNGHGQGKGIETVLGPGVHYQGTLSGSGGVRIEGTFDGTLTIKGPVVITDGARVTAEIQAGAVSVGGSVKGNITASKVEILSTGRVWGDLVTTAFATEEGAFLRGQVQMEDAVAPPTALEETQPRAVIA